MAGGQSAVDSGQYTVHRERGEGLELEGEFSPDRRRHVTSRPQAGHDHGYMVPDMAPAPKDLRGCPRSRTHFLREAEARRKRVRCRPGNWFQALRQGR